MQKEIILNSISVFGILIFNIFLLKKCLEEPQQKKEKKQFNPNQHNPNPNQHNPNPNQHNPNPNQHNPNPKRNPNPNPNPNEDNPNPKRNPNPNPNPNERNPNPETVESQPKETVETVKSFLVLYSTKNNSSKKLSFELCDLLKASRSSNDDDNLHVQVKNIKDYEVEDFVNEQKVVIFMLATYDEGISIIILS